MYYVEAFDNRSMSFNIVFNSSDLKDTISFYQFYTRNNPNIYVKVVVELQSNEGVFLNECNYC